MAKVDPKYLLEGLIKRGARPVEAAAIVGNGAQESGFDTEAVGDGGQAFGIWQHNGLRKNAMLNAAKAEGRNIADPDFQMDYVWHELNTSENKALKAMRKTDNPRHTSYVFSKYFERPNPKYANNAHRMSAAESFFKMINPIGTANADEMQDIDPAEFAQWEQSQQQPQKQVDIDPEEFAAWEASQQSAGKKVGEVITDIGGGVLKGASNIGNTILSAADSYNELLGNKNALTSQDTTGEERRKQATEGLKSMGVDTDSGTYKAAELGTEIAGTAGTGGVLAKGAAKVAPSLVESLASSGMAGANLAQKAAGGAITGAASAGLVDPETTIAGGVLGAALPPALNTAGKAGQLVGGSVSKVYKEMTQPVQVKVANKIVEATGKTKKDVIDILTKKARAKELPDLLRTVPQILQDPHISQLARTVKTNSSMALSEAEGAQQAAYKKALESIAPSNSTLQDAADKAGSAIGSAVQEDYKIATKEISKMFNALRNNPENNIELPIDKLKSTVDQYLGKGTVGKGSGAKAALNEAANLSKPIPVEESKIILPKSFQREVKKPALEKVGFKELQNLRSSIGDLARQSKLAGKNTENAALKQMVSDIDNHLDSLANSSEGMGSETLNAYKEARTMHKAKIDRFKTGAQAGLFKAKSNGEMAVEGGQIPGKFYNLKDSQTRDVQSFKRLVGNSEALIKELKGYALTKAGQTATATGNLGQAYVKWARSHSGANQELFTVGEKAKIDAVAREISMSSSAENLGRVTGSDTAQKLKSIIDLGFIDNKAVNYLAHKIPAGNALLTAIKESSGRERSNMIAELLANPDKLAEAIKKGEKATKSQLSYKQGKKLQLLAKALPSAAVLAGSQAGRQ